MNQITVTYFYDGKSIFSQTCGHLAMSSVPVVGDYMTIAGSMALRVTKRTWVIHRNGTMEIEIILE